MPEIPDLQAFSQNLSKKLIGKTVEKIHAIKGKKPWTPEKVVQEALGGAQISSVYREGKELHFAFSNGHVLGIHLMLKGELHLFNEENDHKFTILELLFTDGSGLAVTDFRRQATPTLNPETKDAPDALSEKLDYEFLREKLKRSRASVKKLLTDQKIIRGIGNAYADEILWHARISPLSVSNQIPDAAIRNLEKKIKTVLIEAEKKILQLNPEIISGETRDFLAVHNPKKTHSPTGAPIRVDESGPRKTYYTDEQELYQ